VNILGIYGAVEVETLDEFCKICGQEFALGLDVDRLCSDGLAYFRAQVPRNVSVVRVEYENDGRRFFDYYLLYSRRGFLYAYQAY